MAAPATLPLVAVDIGNSRLKLGLFAAGSAAVARFATGAKPSGMLASASLPTPQAELDLPSNDWAQQTVVEDSVALLAQWLAKHAPRGANWKIASVFRAAATQLQTWIATNRPGDNCRLLTNTKLPIGIAVEQPERVGIDRLLAAIAVNRLRSADRPAVIADLGSAITVDLVYVAGDFCGGAILPGIGMSARALCEQTDVLPHLPMTQLDAPPAPLGRSTQAAIESGLFWGAVGAVRELAMRLGAQCETEPELFLTGGAAPSVARLLGANARYEPHLVLAGIALSGGSNDFSTKRTAKDAEELKE
jgi:type III pantothenate kinase